MLHPAFHALASLGFDPDTLLLRDSHVVLDPHFLAALHAEVDLGLPGDAGRAALFQIGFLHGLRDGARVLAGADPRYESAAPPSAPGLAMRMRPPPIVAAGEIPPLDGAWPERREATAHEPGEPPTRPDCAVSAGYTSGWLSAILEDDILALEQRCCACGAESCEFVARRAEEWSRDGDLQAAKILPSLPFDEFRELLSRNTGSRGDPPPDPGAFDPDAPVIHIWGPVMVLPFAGVDEAIRAVELIGCDPSAAEVSVVVIDLAGAVLDEAFGAVALEQILASVDAWGADSIVAGVSPLAEPIVAGLEHPPVVVEKDIHHAIARAFQIADSQRHLV